MVVTLIEAMSGGRGTNSALRLDDKLRRYEEEIDNKILRNYQLLKKVRYDFPLMETKIVVKILRLKYEEFYDVREKENHMQGISLIFSEK